MSKKFEPKVPVELNPPKDDPISVEDLAKANGMYSDFLLDLLQPPIAMRKKPGSLWRIFDYISSPSALPVFPLNPGA